MKKTHILALTIFVIIILVYVVTQVDSKDGSYLDSLAKIAATGGLLGLLYQFMRERDLNEADFILRINQNFITNPDITRIYKILEESKEVKQKEDPFKSEDIIDMANYLSFFEPFYDLIERKIVHIEAIDPVLAYRFFLATNNRFMQEKLLCVEGKEVAWQAIYMLHQYWKTYRERNARKVWQKGHDLSETPAFKKSIDSAL